MSISNGDFTDESGNAVNLMALLRDGSVVESNADHHMAPHSGWFTDEEGEPVNISIPKVSKIGSYAFQNCSALTKIYLPSCVSRTSIASGSTFSNCTSLSDIYVPKSELDYFGAPWGAPNATVHYDTQFDENGEPILE